MSDTLSPAALDCLAEYELQVSPAYWLVDKEHLVNYLGAKVGAGSSLLLDSESAADASSVAIWRELDFDSEIYATRMGRIDWIAAEDLESQTRQKLLGLVIQQAEERGIQHLTFRINARDPHLVQLAEEAGFRMATSFVGLARLLNGKDLATASFLHCAEPGDLEALRRITREAFAAETRFHFDLRLPSAGTERLHQCWIENCLEGKAADCVFVARIDGQVAGYITCQVDPAALAHLGQARGSIGLFAVDPKARGRGLGAGLLEGAQAWLVDQGVARIEVGTESFNYGALHSYLRAGFRLVQSSFTLHRWADGGNNA